MNNIDPAQERVSSLRRSRIARRGLVLGAVAGSLGIAGALGLSAAVNPGAPGTGGAGSAGTSSGATAPNGGTSGGGDDGGGNPAQKWTFVGGDDGGEHGEAGESDDGGQWVPVQPSQQFGGGAGSNANGGGGGNNANGGGGLVAPPHATSGGS